MNNNDSGESNVSYPLEKMIDHDTIFANDS
jgi:hypothetical protein